ncbi:TIGR01906 family membrane protein [Clostridioides mangenotii]|uniref:TIGR01906 family membrane protein n=1 Tax=Metaclostridioides mangenotii TaxID=1540 RepID=UPI001C1177A9|nr:TIGR01906 family membrane protein [Clostridioides mangenotii]MCR1955421.1 TIGR01906 family membrane protein [Clostridioides mangenotii]
MNKGLNILFSIFFSLLIIGAAVRITVGFRDLYYYDIDKLKITEMSGMSKQDIKLNYDYLIDYNLNKKVDSFKLPTLPSSEFGKIHFEEVREIIQNVIKLFYICIVVCLFGTILSVKKKNIDILKITSISLIVMPIVVSIPILVNFERSFVVFHELLFSNDYWIFDPALDPVIMMLPEQFFLHAGLMILILILFTSIFLYLSYRFFRRKLTR